MTSSEGLTNGEKNSRWKSAICISCVVSVIFCNPSLNSSVQIQYSSLFSGRYEICLPRDSNNEAVR
jgi:hypothetical protein